MRPLIKLPRALQEASPPRDGMYRAKLSEDYDGIGQYVLVTLAGSSIGSAYKARVAAGDFGGSRTFPTGTPVVVHSYRGQLEVFLGNIPQVCDLFNRVTGRPNGGWDEGRYGPWLTFMELYLASDGSEHSENAWVDEGTGRMQYTNDPYSDPVMGLNFPDGMGYPIEVEWTQYVEDYYDDVNGQVYFGPRYHHDHDSWVVWSIGRSSGQTVFYVSWRSDGTYDWPPSSYVGAGEINITEDLAAASLPRTAKVEFTETGSRGKTWHPETEAEPDDWQVEMVFSTPPPASMFQYVYIESQNFALPITDPQPIFHLDKFCLSHG